MISENRIKSIFTTDGTEYTIKSKSFNSNNRLIIYNCTFKKTNYNTIIVDKSTHTKIIELYPPKISHIIYYK